MPNPTDLETLPDGVHTHADYRADPARLSPNGARKLLPPSTPARFDWDRKHPPKTKPVWDFGLVAHKIVLGEGGQFLVLDPEIHGLKKDGTVAENPRATTTWKAWEAEARAQGLTPIHRDDYLKAVEMAQTVYEHPTAGPLLADGDAERWLYWTDTESGQPLRQRLDWQSARRVHGRLAIVEYKTAADADPEVFARKAYAYGYHLAAAFALDGAKTLQLDELLPAAYLFVVQEKEPPYLVSVCELDVEAIQVGRRRMREAISIYQHCMKTGEWPGYPAGINPISLPPWATDDEMEISE